MASSANTSPRALTWIRSPNMTAMSLLPNSIPDPANDWTTEHQKNASMQIDLMLQFKLDSGWRPIDVLSVRHVPTHELRLTRVCRNRRSPQSCRENSQNRTRELR